MEGKGRGKGKKKKKGEVRDGERKGGGRLRHGFRGWTGRAGVHTSCVCHNLGEITGYRGCLLFLPEMEMGHLL